MRYPSPMVVIVAGFLSGACAAANAPAVPPQLRDWVPWVLDKHKDLPCPPRYSLFADRICAWPASLSLDVGASGAQFAMQWHAFAPSWIALPGGDEYWPRNVAADGRTLPVIRRDGVPMAFIEAGAARIAGKIPWTRRPKSLRIPAACALVSLRVDGRPLEHPAIDGNGMLWFGSQPAAAREETMADAQEIKVFRKIIDNVPLYIESEIRLTVSGRDRELVMGRFLPEGAAPVSLTSTLPARIEKNGSLRAQASAGTWIIRLRSRQEAVDAPLRMDRTEGPWPAQEVWVFQADPGLRSVSVKGVTPVDPQQTMLPDAWKQLPAFLVEPGDTLRPMEEFRGDWSPSPNDLSISRTFWLDFNGRGGTVRDEIAGAVTRPQRLSLAPGYGPGRVELDGRPQLITALHGERPGIELRQGALRMSAVSRYKGAPLSLPAAGWDLDFKRASAEINLPPGWAVFHVTGADSVSDSWISRWTLWDLFLLLIIAGACGRLLGIRWGILCAAALALCFHEQGAPLYSFFNLIAALALLSVLPRGKARQAVGWYRIVSYALVLCIGMVFTVRQIRTAMYPQLDFKEKISGYSDTLYEKRRAKAHGYPAAGRVDKTLKALVEAEAPSPPPPPQSQVQGPPKMDFQSQQSAVPEERIAAQTAEVDDRLGSSAWAVRQSLNLSDEQYDPLAKVQTGPGEPAWSWERVSMQWNGPVDKSQRLSLMLMPPWLNRLLNLLRVAGLIWLIYGFLSHEARGRMTWHTVRNALYPAGAVARVAAALAICLFAAVSARAEFPPESMLTELERRLTEEPPCFPECATMAACRVTVSEQAVDIAMTVDADRQVALPLPGNRQGWRPQAVLIDGKPAGALRCAEDGTFWAVARRGRSTVSVRGVLAGTSVSIPFPLEARAVSVASKGWRVSGLIEGRLPGASLMLDRLSASPAGAPSGAALLPDPAPAFVEVVRTVVLRTEWSAATAVRRIAPAQGSITLRVSLLDGESVISPGVKDSAGAVTVVMGADQGEFSWNSALKKSDSLVFAAPSADDRVELWRIDASPDWHVETEGLAAVKQEARQSAVVPLWKPRPGERLVVSIEKPQAVQGATRTVESVAMSTVPGKRWADNALRISVRSSQADKLCIALAGDVELGSVQADGRELIASVKNSALNVPLRPGRQEIAVAWKQRRRLGLLDATPVVDLADTCANIDLAYRLPADRWALMLGGPSIGPAMLIWGMLIVMLAAAWALGRLNFLPVRTWQWFVLFLGMSTVNNFGGFIVIVWFLAMARRSVWANGPKNPAFNAAQTGIVLLTIAAITALVATIPVSLLSSPNMQIVGNGSSSHEFCWYQDRAAGKLPAGWVVALPLWAYRVTMLVWSFYMAVLLPRWAGWGWKAFSAGGIWRKRERQAKRLAP